MEESQAYDHDGTAYMNTITSDSVTLPVNSTYTSILDYDDAVISACSKENASEEEKEKLLSLLSTYNMRPIMLRNSRGEGYALVHESIMEGISSPDLTIAPIPPNTKRKRLHTSQSRPEITRDLESLLSTSIYAETLQKRTFVELDYKISKHLNTDWMAYPQLRYACAQLLAGCILLNSKNGHAVIVNTVEVYGRKISVDTHCEPCYIVDSHPIQTSLPPTYARYSNVWPLTMDSEGTERLIIGTQIFHAQITSSLRLDSNFSASVGDMPPSFRLTDRTASCATKIYLDQESIKLASKIMKDRNAWCISRKQELWQLRSIKSNFHDPCTYYLCRASSSFAQDIMCQPFTLFNIGTFDQSDAGCEKVGAELMEIVSTQVISQGKRAYLEKSTVSTLLNRCQGNSKISHIFSYILALFSDDVSKIRIIANPDLNVPLEALAKLLIPYVNSVNGIVSGFISAEFSLSRQE
ncbi:hypothetical protein BGZ76_010929 [Entomortierella beljakovae]|nr:hypothetical protein BGZ76_010929 [Entomortierella beljakovae]